MAEPTAPVIGGGSGAAQPRLGAFAALRFQEYRLLWTGGLIVFVAVTAQGIARGWLARELTGTNTGLGGVMMGFGLPMLLATPWGGVAADRLSKRLVVGVAVVLLVLSSAWIGLAVAFDAIEYWMLVVASGIQAVAFALYGPARMAFTAELVDRRTLPNAVALGQMSSEASRVVGPALAGVLIGAAAFGTAGVFLLGAAMCTVALITTFWLPPGRPRGGRPVRSPVQELTDGLAYVRREPGLLLLVLTSLGVVMIGFPYMAFLPTVADAMFDVGSGGYGLMAAVASTGAVAAGLMLSRRDEGADHWRFLGLAGLGFSSGLVLLGVAPRFWVALVVLPIIGASGLAFQAVNQSLLLTLSSFEYHGRLQSLVMVGFSGFGIAALPLGVLADAISLRATLVIMGSAVLVIIGAFSLRRRRYRLLTMTRDFG